MSLYTRLIGLDQPKIAVHSFMSYLGEIERGKLTESAAATAFGLSAGEQTELATLVTKVIAPPEFYPMGALVTLTNVGTAYDGIAAAKGLGFVGLNVNGITQVIFRVRYNKVGAGTLSWQLWNETDTSELGVIDDASAAGDNKDNSVTITPGSPLSGGVKLIRPRVKSTTASDDPVYYGSCLLVRRVERMTSQELHEVLCLAEHGEAYATEAVLKTRLGV